MKWSAMGCVVYVKIVTNGIIEAAMNNMNHTEMNNYLTRRCM